MLRACCAALADPRPGAGEEDLTACAVMGDLWACCRARLADSLTAMRALEQVTLDAVVDVAAGLPVEERAPFTARAMHVVGRVSAQHTLAAARSYDSYLLRQIERANSEDRMELARDLHDRLGCTLVLAFRHLEIYRNRSTSGVDDRHLTAIQDSLDEATAFTRMLVSGLRAEAPMRGFADTLREAVDALNFRDVPVTLSVNGDETWLLAHHRDELHLVVREFLRNSFTHADPRSVTVHVAISPHRVDIDAADDGRGFIRPAVACAGSGLGVMQERVERLGGGFTLHSTPGKGTRAVLWAPLRAPGNAA